MMERIQGPINSCLFGDCFEQQGFINTENEEQVVYVSTLEDEKMPFLQMLQSVESPQQFYPFSDSTFQTLLRLQQNLKKQQKQEEEEGHIILPRLETQVVHAKELESCVTNDGVEIQSSPVKSETNEESHNDILLPHTHSLLSPTIMVEKEEGENHCRDSKRRKRKRMRPVKNKEEVENQRMTHIAVERNRRRQMNDHLSVLRTLMPPSYIQRGDQASIIGGAIDFVKELEQLLHTLEAEKRIRKKEEIGCSYNNINGETLKSMEAGMECGGKEEEEEVKEAEIIEVMMIQTHVNLKIRCRKRQGQLVRAIVGLDELKLSVLHLNITSSLGSVLYCFNLKVEEECELGSANEIAEAVGHLFRALDN